MGKLPEARAACARAIAADPDASWALYLSGVIALRDTSPAGTKVGIGHLRRAINADPGLGQAWRTLAKAYARAKDGPALDQLGKDYAARFGQPLPP
jgi:predicted Zn-dependent protease